jgi:hypothetical protein
MHLPLFGSPTMSEPAVASLNPADTLAEGLILCALDIQSGSSKAALEFMGSTFHCLPPSIKKSKVKSFIEGAVGMGNSGGKLSQPNLKDEPSDEVVEDFIAKHPDGASCDAIGEVLGVCSVRVRQILKSALEKALRNAIRRNVSPHDYPSKQTVWDRIASS